jgi:hypothetical protein
MNSRLVAGRDKELGSRRLYIHAALVEVGGSAFASNTVNGTVGLRQLRSYDRLLRSRLADTVDMSQFLDTSAAMILRSRMA